MMYLYRFWALLGISQYTNPSHIARAVLEANAYQTRAIIESMKLDSGSDLKYLKVDGGMTNGDLAMQILADLGGFIVVRPEMREYVSEVLESVPKKLILNNRSTALGSALCAGAAIKLFGWDLNKPESLRKVNVKGSIEFNPSLFDFEREKKWAGWQRAIERSRGWEVGVDEGA